ncbi:hypothetical protein [Sodalinema gerasimenkoae]|uniref:hypothetical protein n=1 Tax=Sodalinema gerasimenkoae TaxID=2862348 RepID=UPI001358AB36|nr:hypothetical protein [Sodalinema gerasimenkoae]
MYNQLSDVNPQLMREIKGRFKTPKVLLALSLSILLQGLVLLLHGTRLPSPFTQYPRTYCYPDAINSTVHYRYIKSYQPDCLQDVAGNLIISWSLWWSHISSVLTAIGITALLVGGLFLLIDNLIKEKDQGNLNFIRLSPQPGSNIILGKLLGVPCLLYVGVAAAIPLHSFAAAHAGYFFGDILRFYILVAAGTFAIYSLAMLYSMSGGKQPLAFCLLIGGLLSYLSLFSLYYLFPLTQFENSKDDGIWFNISLLKTPLYSQVFWIVSCLILSGFIFQIISRRYQKPNATLITKKQGYVFCAVYNLYAVGFLVGYLNRLPFRRSLQIALEGLTVYNLALSLFLIGLALSLSPNRQNLQDWARYRHRLAQPGGQSHYSLRQDLLWGEKSPSILAMAINLILSIAILGIGLLTWNHRFLHEEGAPFVFSIGILILFGWLAGYSFLVQHLSFTTTASKHRWVIGLVLILLIIGPPVLLALFDPSRSTYPQTRVLFIFGVSPWLVESPELFAQGLQLLLAQVLGIGLMLSLFAHQLRCAGQSELKRLMSNSPAKTFSKAPKGS